MHGLQLVHGPRGMTRAQDTELMAGLLQRFMQRAPINGLPHVLKPPSQKRRAGVARTVSFHPRNSHWDADLSLADLDMVHEALLARATPNLPGRPRPTCKNRLPQVIRAAQGSARRMIASVVAARGPVSPELTRLFNMAADRARLEAMRAGPSEHGSLLIALLKMYLGDEVETEPAESQLRGLQRELFISGFIRRLLTPSEEVPPEASEPKKPRTKSRSRDESSGNFVLSPLFEQSLCGVGMAPFFRSLLTAKGRLQGAMLSGLVDCGSSGASNNESLLLAHLLAQSQGGGWAATLSVREEDDQDDPAKPAPAHSDSETAVTVHMDPPGWTRNGDSQATKTLRRTCGHYDRSLSRVSAAIHICPDDAPDQAALPEEAPSRSGVDEEWLKPSKLKTFLTTKTLAVLAAKPGASLQTVHGALQLLDRHRVQTLLTRLREEGLIRGVAAGVTAALDGPFQRTPTTRSDSHPADCRYFISCGG
mmetsp:Transcript_32517/g.46892  ORF Transcript_32517/g.46892 Transcript_32517/m.46892 type:complete len:479 (-) Transcript_32517:1073-2509(-)